MARGPNRSKGRISWRKVKNLVASAASTDTATGKDLMDLHQPWQATAFGYYHRMGECWNPVQFTARAMSKIRLYAATGDPEDPEELESGWAYDLVQEWQHVPEPYGRLRTLIGEGRLCQSVNPIEQDQGVVWEFLSPVELKRNHEGKIIRSYGKATLEYQDISAGGGAGVGGEPGPGQIRMWRFWRPDPENSGMADSAFRGVLDLYEQLWWLTLSERADLRNRVINQGMLLIPEEIDFVVEGAEDAALDGEDPEIDPFTELIQQIVTAALQNPGSAEAAAPPVVRAEADLLHPDKFRVLKFHDPSSSLYITGREDALMRRISIGLDMPTEAFMGMGTLNHWNAWKLEDEKYQHIEPTISALTDDLTNAVLRPIGRASNAPDAEEVFIAADIADLVSDPDRGKTALALYQEAVITAAATARENGFEESDLMTDEAEKESWRADHGQSAPAEPDPATNEEPPAEPVDEQAPSTNGEVAPVNAARFADAAVTAARASAATWIRSKRRTCPECIEAADQEGHGDDFLAALGPGRMELLEITAEQVSSRMRDAFYKACAMFRVEFPITSAHHVERYFAETLFDPQPFPDELAAELVP